MDIGLIAAVVAISILLIYISIPFVFFLRTEVIPNEPVNFRNDRFEFDDPKAIITYETKIADNEFDFESRKKIILYYWLICDSERDKEIAREHILWFVKNAIEYEGHWFAWMVQFATMSQDEARQRIFPYLSDSVRKSGDNLQALRNAGTFTRFFDPEFSEICWNKLREEFPDDPQVNYELGWVYRIRNKYQELLEAHARLVNIPWSDEVYYKFRKTKLRFRNYYPVCALKIPLYVNAMNDWLPHRHNLIVLTELINAALVVKNLDAATEYLIDLINCIDEHSKEYPLVPQALATAARVYLYLGHLNFAKIFIERIGALEGESDYYGVVEPLLRDLVKFNYRNESEVFWASQTSKYTFSDKEKSSANNILSTNSIYPIA